MDADTEIRLRLVEALTRTDGSMARNNPQQFVGVVAEIEKYVKKENDAQAAAPAPQEETPAKRGRSKADTAVDFMA